MWLWTFVRELSKGTLRRPFFGRMPTAKRRGGVNLLPASSFRFDLQVVLKNLSVCSVLLVYPVLVNHAPVIAAIRFFSLFPGCTRADHLGRPYNSVVRKVAV